MDSFLKIWEQFEMPTADILPWQLGPLHVWFKNIAAELWVAYEHIDPEQGAAEIRSVPPEDVNWLRYAFQAGYHNIQFVPLLPNRPLVVKTEAPFRLLNDAETKIYIRVPIWVKIEMVNKKKITLTELPTVTLSNTWFGSFTEGELCYWLSSGARRTIAPDAARPYMVICPINVINRADEDLFVEKICLRVANLSLFYDGIQLWSDETNVFYKGSSEFSDLEVTGVAPSEAKSAQLIASPRNPVKKSIASRTFTTIKDISGISLFGN
ncbi:DUF432 domain-containing protein [candidate division KSB1 bacterium]|nr:DUF432 domain-containing protein [candidate division KSB1 bacterium]